jgi:hypothetical protein
MKGLRFARLRRDRLSEALNAHVFRGFPVG